MQRYVLLSVLVCTLVFISASVSDTAEVFPRRNAIVRAIEKAGPAVVNINTEELIQQRYNPFYSFGDRFIDDFFKDFFPPQSYSRQSLGSGVIITSEGYILTNQHVISGATKIKVTLIDNREFEARLIGADVRSDLAVIKIDDRDKFPYVKMHRSDDLLIGETVVAIGNPFGLSHTVTTGIISAVNRSIKGEGGRVYSDFIQLDASINPGNSGGPLLNINGQLIGINTAIYQKAEGIGFAIPIDRAKRIVDDLINYGEVHEAWIGILAQEMTRNLSYYFKFSGNGGVLITKVFINSPAETAGLKSGDIIKSVGSKVISNMEDYNDQIASYSADDKIKIVIFRNGKEKNINLYAGSVPPNLAEEIAREWLGITVTDITRRLIRRYDLFADSGVLITHVSSGSAIAKIGVRTGDVLRQINSNEITNSEDFKKAIIAARKSRSVLLLIQRGRNGYYITLEP